MPLEEDLVARTAVVFTAEEVVEAHLVERGRAGIGGQVPADTRRPVVRPQHHGHGIPADQPSQAPLELLVAGKERLLLGADGVDVAGLGQRRQAHVKLSRTLENLVEHEPGALVPLLAVDLIKRVEPLLGLGGIDVG